MCSDCNGRHRLLRRVLKRRTCSAFTPCDTLNRIHWSRKGVETCSVSVKDCMYGKKMRMQNGAGAAPKLRISHMARCETLFRGQERLAELLQITTCN